MPYNNDRLARCPFCGKYPKIVVTDAEGNEHTERRREKHPSWSGLSFGIRHYTKGVRCPVETAPDSVHYRRYATRKEAEEAWNTRLSRGARKPSKAKGLFFKYRVVWSVEHATDEFDAGYDLEDAKRQATELIYNWVRQFYGKNHDDIVGDWDQMVLNSEVAVYEYDPEKKEFETAWEPSDKDLDEIGFIPSDEMNDVQKAVYFGNSDEGHCGNCALCDGVDEASDTCVCKIDDPHADWRYRNNEKCPKWRKE